jgi:GT2 family glycosyltransferase
MPDQPNNAASVTVIIVNWNSGAVLDKCLDHVLNQTQLPARILVMDNGSSDDSIARVAKISQVNVRLLGANLGFAAANNRALLECNSDYIALLNPDAFPNPDWLERLLEAAAAYPDVSAFASLQLCDDNPEYMDGAGDCYHISGLVWRDRHGDLLTPADLKNMAIFSPCAAAALYRRQAFIDEGAFDEDYFCYVEDVDLGFRLSLAGHKAMYIPDAVVHHVGSATTGGQHSDFSLYHGHRNLVWTFIKNMPGILFWLLLPYHVLLNLATIVCFAYRGKGAVIIRAKWDAIKGIPKMWQKRRLIQKKRKASILEIWRLLDKRLLPFRRLTDQKRLL